MTYLKHAFYKNRGLGFPNDFVNESKKDEKYFKQLAQAVLSDYFNNRTFIGFDGRSRFSSLRSYGNGDQDPAISMGQVFHNYGKKRSDGGEADRKGFSHIDPTIIPIMVKFKQTILGMFDDVDYDARAVATDQGSRTEKEKKKWEMMADSLLQDVIDEVDREAGIPKIGGDRWKPKDEADLNLFESLGGFRLAAEIGIEKMVKHAMETDSPWKEIKEKLIEDAVDIGYMAVMDYTSIRGQRAEVSYADPEQVVAKYQRRDEFDSMKYGAIFQRVSINDLRSTGQFTEEKLKKIAQAYISHNRTDGFDWSYYSRYHEDVHGWGYDPFMVDVLVGWYRGFETTYRQKTVSSKGRTIRDEAVEWMKKGENVYSESVERLYKFKYVLGVDMVYDFGFEHDVAYDDQGRVRMPLQIVRITGKPITERCIPNLNNMQNAWLKFQNALNKSRPPGLAVNYDSLASMGIKDKKMSPREILRITINDGNLVYRGTTKSGMNNMAGGKPVYELEGGMGKQLQEFIQVFELNRSFMQETSGIPPEASGGEVSDRQTAKFSQQQVMNTNRNLKTIISKYFVLKQRSAENVSTRVQNLLQFSSEGRKYYEAVVGKMYVEASFLPGQSLRSIGLGMQIRPDAEIKEKIRASALESMKSGKSGMPGITEADYMLVEMILENGNLKEAQKRLEISIREATERTERRAKEAQTQAEQANIQMKKLENEKEQMKIEAKLKEIETKARVDNEYELKKLDKQIELERVKRGLDAKMDLNVSEN